jgi:hypothetical protein
MAVRQLLHKPQQAGDLFSKWSNESIPMNIWSVLRYLHTSLLPVEKVEDGVVNVQDTEANVQ